MFLNKKRVYFEIATDQRAWLSFVINAKDDQPITLTDMQRVVEESGELRPDEFVTEIHFDAKGVKRDDSDDEDEDEDEEDDPVPDGLVRDEGFAF